MYLCIGVKIPAVHLFLIIRETNTRRRESRFSMTKIHFKTKPLIFIARKSARVDSFNSITLWGLIPPFTKHNTTTTTSLFIKILLKPFPFSDNEGFEGGERKREKSFCIKTNCTARAILTWKIFHFYKRPLLESALLQPIVSIQEWKLMNRR